MTKETEIAKGEACPCCLVHSHPRNLPAHGYTQTLISKTFWGSPGLNIFFCSISPASETGVTVFPFAALCIHLLFLDPDLTGPLEICNGSSISLGLSGHCCNHSEFVKDKNLV